MRNPILLLTAFLAAAPLWAASYYTVRLNDSKAVYLTRDQFGVRGDGVADDTADIQKAINHLQETTGQGVLFIPEGRYRLTKTIYIWPGIRLIGYGAHRPVLVLNAHTPGFQQGPTYMVFFAGNRPGSGWGHGFVFRPPTAQEQAEAKAALARRLPPGFKLPHENPNAKPSDASPGTFYSALSNVDIEIGEGNPGAAAIRGR